MKKIRAQRPGQQEEERQISDLETTAIYFAIDKFARLRRRLRRRLRAQPVKRGAFNCHDCVRHVKLINYGIALIMLLLISLLLSAW